MGDFKADPGTYYQPQSPAGGQTKELSGQERDTVIVLDSTDSKMAETVRPNTLDHQANMSTAARTTFPASRAGSQKKAPKQTAQVEVSKPAEPKEEELDDDIAHHLYETIKCVGCFQPPV